jgi:4-amino-4-deoxy-L-arabinose transferase-like glycosyltransferase
MSKLIIYLKKNPEYLILSIFFLIYEFLIWLWLGLNKFNFYDDVAVQFLFAVRIFRNLFLSGDFHGGFQLSNFFSAGTYPPLVYLITAIFFKILGTTIKVAVLSQAPFVLALILGLYALSKKLYNRSSALLITFITLTSPMVVFISKFYLLDLPLTAMVVLCTYFLFECENFKRFGATLGFGIAFTLGMLTKFTFLIYISGPLLMVFYNLFSEALKFIFSKTKSNLKEKVYELKAAFGNLGIAILFFAALYLIFLNMGVLYNFLSFIKGGQYSTDRHILFNFNNLIYYFLWLKNPMLLNLVFFLFAIGFLITFSHKSYYLKNAPLLLSIIFSYLALAFVPVSAPRFFLPVLPFVVMIAISWLQLFKSYKWILLVPVLALSLLQWVGGFGVYYYPQYRYLLKYNPVSALYNKTNVYDHFKIKALENFPVYLKQVYLFPALDMPSKVDWPNEEIVKEILRHRSLNKITYVFINDNQSNQSIGLPSVLNVSFMEKFPPEPKLIYFSQFGLFNDKIFFNKLFAGPAFEALSFTSGDKVFVITRKEKEISKSFYAFSELFKKSYQQEFKLLKNFNCPDHEIYELYELSFHPQRTDAGFNKCP